MGTFVGFMRHPSRRTDLWRLLAAGVAAPQRGERGTRPSLVQACGAAPQGECSSTRTYASLVLARGAAPQGGMQLNVCLRRLGLNPCAPSRLVVGVRPLLQCGHVVPHPKGDTAQPVAGLAGPRPACLLGGAASTSSVRTHGPAPQCGYMVPHPKGEMARWTGLASSHCCSGRGWAAFAPLVRTRCSVSQLGGDMARWTHRARVFALLHWARLGGVRPLVLTQCSMSQLGGGHGSGHTLAC